MSSLILFFFTFEFGIGQYLFRSSLYTICRSLNCLPKGSHLIVPVADLFFRYFCVLNYILSSPVIVYTPFTHPPTHPPTSRAGLRTALPHTVLSLCSVCVYGVQLHLCNFPIIRFTTVIYLYIRRQSSSISLHAYTHVCVCTCTCTCVCTCVWVVAKLHTIG